MAIRIALSHITNYRYDRSVGLSPQVVRLRPAPHCRTPVTAYSLRVTPGEHFCNWQQDPHGNFLARLVFPKPVRHLRIEVDLVAELTVINPFDFFLEPTAETYPFSYDAWLAKELQPFLETEAPGPRLAAFLEAVDRTEVRTVDFLVALNRRLQQEIRYLIRMEPGVQTPEQTLAAGSGSCRDTAWLEVQLLRRLGLAARFVSGYLIQLAPDVKPLEGPEGPSHDFTDLHAWTEVYLPGAGWVGLDPTSGLLAGEGHLPLAATPDPASAAPLTGRSEPCEPRFDFSMSIERIHEDPRVTRPYTPDQWQQIEALGHEVDRRLEAGDVRLTMGGEPTFVSIDDMEGDEWNTEAVGPTKRRLAGALLGRLYRHFAPGGLLHFGQGKWYPGEPLPRWALSCYWRKDGQPLWLDPDLFAEEDRDYEHGIDDAQRLARELAVQFGVGEDRLLPAYEDTWYYLWKERRLPTNVDPFDSKLDDLQERARLARIFEQGLAARVGYVLPLRRAGWGAQRRWVSGPWFLRPERMYLLPGDSPLGFRLPLDSLPWLSEVDFPRILERDPLDAWPPLAEHPRTRVEPVAASAVASPVAARGGARLAHQSRVAHRTSAAAGATALGDHSAGTLRHGENGSPASRHAWPARPPYGGQDDGESGGAGGSGSGASDRTDDSSLADDPASALVRTALCVEPREGRLHVFLPPVETVEDFIDLVARVEAAVEACGTPVVLEGYTPPHDPRLAHIKVTPDPGVIEVNVHPASNWSELVENTTTLYHEARQTRLGTEKFMLDGRHSGTGGGNHVVLGGPTPAESPLLRRPDLLRSLVGYWLNHPALSYVFCGMFVGPTSQAPRMDEGRRDAVHELQVAFEQIPESGSCPPWLVDRVFRNLLVDGTGNTHRAEFCIDKLYSPDTAGGRLGLLEFRAFEMPPHPQMSLTQQLLLRALVARFWEQPYRTAPVRWGTALHDRFLLPHFIELDFEDVLADLRASGFPLERGWFAPHFEFRFPLIGRVAHRSVEIELRQAIEPWYVLGEEPAGGATARYVDSSVERLQVMVRGMTDPRHLVTCNGRRLPLHPTGEPGQFVAGVRFRAWQPPSCLHPTIGVHTPLVFDVMDTWQRRSLGGCTYHVSHPGGLNYTTFPVNAYEAEARRAARFFKLGHTPARFDVPPPETNPDFPFTLDLRTSQPPA